MAMQVSQTIIVINQLNEIDMKRIYILFVFAFICMGIFSQANYDAFIGTWVYQNNDTVFKIKLQKGTMKGYLRNHNVIFGGYSLSVKGVVKENYIKTMPATWDADVSAPSCNIYIRASSDTPNYLGFTFYAGQWICFPLTSSTGN